MKSSSLPLLLQFRETEWRKAVEPGAAGKKKKKRTPVVLKLVLVSMDAWECNFHVSHQGTVVSRSALKIVVMALR